MNKRRLGGIGAAVLVLGALGAGGWYGWDTGAIGNNPNAPTPENFRRLFDDYIKVHDPLPADECMELTWARNPQGLPGEARAWTEAEDMRVAGVEGDLAPQFRTVYYTLAPRDLADSSTRREQLAVYDRLAKEGFYEASDVQLVGPDDAQVPARAYTMTIKGWQVEQRNLCLTVATMRAVHFRSAEPIGQDEVIAPEFKHGWRIRFYRTIADISPWAKSPAFAHEIQRVSAESNFPDQLLVLRDEQGLRIPSERAPIADGKTKMPKPADIQGALADPELAARLAPLAAFAPGLYLPAERHHVDDAWGPNDKGPYYAVYYDTAQKPGRERAIWEERLKALVALGVMEAVHVEAETKAGGMHPAGTRYTLKTAPARLEYRQPGYAYAVAGKFDLTFLQIHENPAAWNVNIVFKGVGEAKNPPAWFTSLKDQALFPEVTLMLNQGQTFKGTGEWTANGFGISGFEAATLRPNTDTLPVADDGSPLPLLGPGRVRMHPESKRPTTDALPMTDKEHAVMRPAYGIGLPGSMGTNVARALAQSRALCRDLIAKEPVGTPPKDDACSDLRQ